MSAARSRTRARGLPRADRAPARAGSEYATIPLVQPARLDLELYQGDDWSQHFSFTLNGAPMDLTGLVFAGQVRKVSADADGGNAALAELTCTVPDPIAGVLVCSLTHTQTETLGKSLDGNAGRWDLQALEGGLTTTYVAGAVTCAREVTRP